MNKELFISRLNFAIKTRNYTQYSLSKKTGINKGSLSSYMSGKYLPKQDKIYILSDALDVNPEWLMCSSDDMELNLPNEFGYDQDSEVGSYPFIEDSVSAGVPNLISGYNYLNHIQIPDFFLGRYAGRKDIVVLKVNGDSMNKIIPDDSIIVVLQDVPLSSLSTDDIVVFSYNYEYGVKKLIKDKSNNRLIFRPESHESCFEDLIVNYGDTNLQIIGKVIMYNVML